MRPPLRQRLRAAARRAAAHASIAAAVSGHDAAAEAAAWGVSQVDNAGEGVGGVNGTRTSDLRFRTSSGSRAVDVGSPFGLGPGDCGPKSEIFEQHLLLAR